MMRLKCLLQGDPFSLFREFFKFCEGSSFNFTCLFIVNEIFWFMLNKVLELICQVESTSENVKKKFSLSIDWLPQHFVGSTESK